MHHSIIVIAFIYWHRKPNCEPYRNDGAANVVVRSFTRALTLAETASFRDAMETEVYGMARCSQTEDAHELSAATIEKRKPVFQRLLSRTT